MKSDRSYFLTVFILLAGIFIILSSGIVQTMGQGDENNGGTSPDDNSVQGNDTIILNPSEINGTYRWTNSSGGINPTLDIIKGNAYQIKINNPTDEEHELIIDTKADGKASEIAKSGDIEPGGKNVEFNFKPDQEGELGYHCEYHPDMMKGTIKVTQND